MSEAAGRVVVLGGTSGIGLASAQQLVRAGHQVTIAGRDPGRLRGALATLMDQADGRTVDATDRAALDSFFEGTGGLGHLVVAVTGARGGGPFRELDLAEVLEGIEAKTLPQLHAVQAALPHLSPNGSITLITAVSARMANPATAGLAVINAGLEAAVRTLAVELAPLRLNAVAPGVIDTPLVASSAGETAGRCVHELRGEGARRPNRYGQRRRTCRPVPSGSKLRHRCDPSR